MPVIAEILQHYLEELAALWTLHERTLQSPDFSIRDQPWWPERVTAQVDGLLVAGAEVIPLLETALSDEDPALCFAAAYVLLRTGEATAIDKVITTFLTAQDKQLESLRAALCHAPIDGLIQPLREAFASAAPATAVVAAEVLAFKGKLDRAAPQLLELLQDEESLVRQRAWRVVAMLGPMRKERS